MNKTTSIIEINGHRYDAVSGQLIGGAKQAAKQLKKPLSGLTVDGFSKPAKIIKKRITGRSIHSFKRRPQHSKTLMRASVKKPAKPTADAKLKTRTLAPDHARVSRAQQVSKSSKVNRFGFLSFSRDTSSVAEDGEVITRHMAAGAQSLAAPLPQTLANASHHRLERLLDYALAHADAHKKTIAAQDRARRRLFGIVPRWLALSLLGLLVAVAIGFFVWYKVPAASMKVASTKAHINASLPTPISGYKIGFIKAEQNAVVTTIQSADDSSKSYTVKVQPATQPAASLAANAGASSSANQQVQTVQDQDKTYVLSQSKDNNTSTAACTKGSNTVSVASIGLNVAQLLDAAKNACKTQ